MAIWFVLTGPRLAGIGKRSASIMLGGLLAAWLLAMIAPQIAAFMRPTLPALVALVLGISFARLEMGDTLRGLLKPGNAARLLAIILLLMPLACLLAVALWRLLGLGEQYALPLLIFFAAPPISSSASLCFLLGYDARTSLQLTLLATLLTPPIGALCFALTGIEIDIPLLTLTLRVSGIIVGGILLGMIIQAADGKARIQQHPDALNGAATLAMLFFLLPLFDGVVDLVREQPATAGIVLLLALLLNFGCHLLVRWAARRWSAPPASANAIGLSFGNRNTAFYLASLPANPLLSLFVAAAQIPIYATPALFRRSRTKDHAQS